MNELALFAGAGGGILGGRLLGWSTVAACEIDPYCRRVLLERQRDGALNAFPIWDDVRTLDGTEWRGCVDVITDGWPCQGFSAAGKGRGFDDERSGLWVEVARLVSAVRPRFVFLENSPRLISSGGLARCLSDLAALGYDAAWDTIGARHVGAPHRRDRCWILAANGNADSDGKPTIAKHDEASRVPGVVSDADRREQGRRNKQERTPQERMPEPARHGKAQQVADAERPRLERYARHDSAAEGRQEQRRPTAAPGLLTGQGTGGWWQAEPDVGRVVDGGAHRVDRLRAIGNGQVPQVAAFAFQALRARLDGRW